jgi:hypothetical protein
MLRRAGTLGTPQEAPKRVRIIELSISLYLANKKYRASVLERIKLQLR